jgi:hypothetical protein
VRRRRRPQMLVFVQQFVLDLDVLDGEARRVR